VLLWCHVVSWRSVRSSRHHSQLPADPFLPAGDDEGTAADEASDATGVVQAIHPDEPLTQQEGAAASSTSTLATPTPGTAPSPTTAAAIHPDNCVPRWARCGGLMHTGATCCSTAGFVCARLNPLFSQCVPAEA